MFDWIRTMFGRQSNADRRYEQAISLADELTAEMRQRKKSSDPFKAVMADLFFQAHPPVDAVVSAYEASQEARIWKGPPK